MTLLYGERAGASEPIEPISWRADRLFLIHSRLGEARHEVAGEWPLA